MSVCTVSPSDVHELLVQSVKLMSNRESHDSFGSHGNESDEEDEGEIVSDDEEMQVDNDKPALSVRWVW